jgi:cytoskeleton protein RodZ
MPEIGATLREARMRARLDVSEIEAKTKIRAKYLRALENEEWGLLPGSTFVKSFLRTYAQALDLDGRALVEEYRLHHERSEAAYDPIAATTQRARQRPPGSGPSLAYTVAVGVVGLVIVLLVVLLIFGGKSKNANTASTATKPGAHAARHPKSSSSHRQAGGTPAIVALSLKPTGVVSVCLLGDNRQRLISGVNLEPGVSTPTFHAHRFELTLGNNSLTMFVDGRARSVPPSGEPIGYSITKANGRRTLTAAQRPICK